MTIRWGSVLANPAGEIEWPRVAHLLSAIACAVSLGLLILDAFGAVPNSEAVTTSVWAGMIPITGGQIAGAISGKRASSRIVTGELPGRRATDTAAPSTTEVAG